MLAVPGRQQPELTLTARNPTELGEGVEPAGIHLPHLGKRKKKQKVEKAIKLFFNADIADKNECAMFYSYTYCHPSGIPTSLGWLALLSSLKECQIQ